MSKTKNEPIEFFENQDQLDEYLKEWQERLFLRDWHIKAFFTDGEQIPGLAGESDVCWQASTGFIDIRKEGQFPAGAIEKQPQELILVHELLHFKFMNMEKQNATIESVYWCEMQHQLIEQLAKALIMAKYNLNYDWFLVED